MDRKFNERQAIVIAGLRQIADELEMGEVDCLEVTVETPPAKQWSNGNLEFVPSGLKIVTHKLMRRKQQKEQSVDTPINDAERAIARILRDLEAKTGQLVEAVELEYIEVTRVEDIAPKHLVNVWIKLQRRPGHEWST